MKAVLDIADGDTSEDKKLLFFCEWASRWIEELLGRELSFKSRTEFYRGKGTFNLVLRVPPVFPAPPPPYSALTVNYDPNGFFGSAHGAFTNSDGTTQTLVYGVDYCLKIDQADGSSRSGILIRINDYWNEPQVRQTGLLAPFVADDPGSFRVTYTGGYTIDTLPSQIRMAANTLVARIRYFFPLGLELGSDGYEEKSIGIITEKKDYLLSTVKDLIWPYRRWKF